MKSKSMKTTCLRAVAVVVLVLSVLFFLHYSFWLLVVSLWSSDNVALELNDDNRPFIGSLLPLVVDVEEAFDIENIEKIEYWSGFRDSRIDITYNDQSEEQLIIRDYGRPRDSLVSYIKENGYIVFFRSAEFFWLVIKTAIPTAFFIASTVFLKKTKPKPPSKRYRFERVTK